MLYIKLNQKRARRASKALKVMVLLSLCSLVSVLLHYNLIGKSLRFELSQQELDSTRVIMGGISFIYGIGFIITAVVFIQWFRRAYYNLHLKKNKLSFSEGWAATSWFLPLINLFSPFLLAIEMVKNLAELIRKHDLGNPENLKLNIVYVWWGLWSTGFVAGVFQNYLSKYPSEIFGYYGVVYFGLAASVLNVLCAIFAIKFVNEYSLVEPLLNQAPHIPIERLNEKGMKYE